MTVVYHLSDGTSISAEAETDGDFGGLIDTIAEVRLVVVKPAYSLDTVAINVAHITWIEKV